MHAAKHPGEGILDSLLQAIPSAAYLLFLAAVRQENAVLCDLPLFLGEPPGVLRPVGQNEKGDDADKNAGRAFDDEKPLPAFDV